MLLGFDIGGTKCAVTIGVQQLNGELNIIDKIVHLTSPPVKHMVDLLFEAADLLLEKHGFTKLDLTGIGISCGGPLSSKKGLILSPPNLPGWDRIPIVEMAESYFDCKAYLQNDANACAVAEWKYGAGRGANNIIFLTFGTGMGAGLILDGRLYSGTTDLAGEVGHMRLAEMGPVGFGKSGSFEGFCSGGGIAQLAQIKVREQLQMGVKVDFCNSIDSLHTLTAKSVAVAARNGDLLAQSIYRQCGFYLGRGLSILIDIINPELIILGSIYERSGELLDPMMYEVIRQEALSDSLADCRIVPAELGDDIGDYAALSLATMIKLPFTQ